MDLRFTDAQEAFRAEVRDLLEGLLAGEFAPLRGRGGPGDEDALVDERRVWERALADGGWNCVGWPKEYGGRGLDLVEQVIFHEEYARARAPGHLGHMGETLLAPTLMAHGTDAQKAEFLPPIRRAEALWCQGYSEPNAGSDLAGVQTRAERDGDSWIITGQKVWTSHAHIADWCFALCRTDTDAPRHEGLSYLLVPMDQDGVDIRPIRQLTGSSEFSEVFFDGARTGADRVVGGVGQGWKVALATLGFERGVSTLGQQMRFRSELDLVIEAARARGLDRDPLMRQRLADAWMGLEVMRLNALRNLSATGKGELGREAMIGKLHWATWHRNLGELAMDVLGPEGLAIRGEPYELDPLQRLFLFSRADTIYAGTNEIQRNIIAQRALGLPRDRG